MAGKQKVKSYKNILVTVLFALIAIGCLWAFLYAGLVTKSFKNKIIQNTYKAKEAAIENLLVTETKNGQKLWEMFADVGSYTEVDGIVLLDNIIGNVYGETGVKASFKADKGTYNSNNKQIILYDNVYMIYFDGTNITTDRLIYSGKDKDIVAEGKVRIERPNSAVIYGSKAVLSPDYKDFNITGRTKTHFYM